MKLKALFISLILLSGWTVFNPTVCAEESKESTSGMPKSETFTDKIVFLTIDKSSALASDNDSVVISEARIEIIGERYFIVGSGYGGEKAWYDGMSVGIAWSTVTRFATMTPAQFEKMSDRWWNRSSGGEKQ